MSNEVVDLFPELEIDKIPLDSAEFYQDSELVLVRRLNGLAAEYLVAAELCLMGYTATMSCESSPYDLIVDTENGLRRIQVKCNLKIRNLRSSEGKYKIGYMVQTHKGKILGNNCDLFAFVAMDLGRVKFIDPFYLQKTEIFFHATDLTEEKCDLSHQVVLKCLGEP